MSFSAIVLCVHIMLDSSGLAGAPIKPNFIYLCIWDLEEATSVISVRFLRNQNHHDYTMHVWVCSFLTACFSENSEFFPPFTHTRHTTYLCHELSEKRVEGKNLREIAFSCKQDRLSLVTTVEKSISNRTERINVRKWGLEIIVLKRVQHWTHTGEGWAR